MGHTFQYITVHELGKSVRTNPAQMLAMLQRTAQRSPDSRKQGVRWIEATNNRFF